MCVVLICVVPDFTSRETVGHSCKHESHGEMHSTAIAGHKEMALVGCLVVYM